MTYCKQDGKDKLIFASNEDLSKPSTANIPEYEEEIDWDCPTCSAMQYMVKSPCAQEFKESYTYFAKHKDNKDPEQARLMNAMFECMQNNLDYFKPDSEESEEAPVDTNEGNSESSEQSKSDDKTDDTNKTAS